MARFTVEWKDYLATKLTLGSFTLGTSRLVEETDQSDINKIVLRNLVNEAPMTTLASVDMKIKRLQILIRAAAIADAEAMGDQIITAMDDVYDGYSTADTTYQAVIPVQSDFFHIEDDKNNRAILSCNWRMTIC